jgi:hypothetical protein
MARHWFGQGVADWTFEIGPGNEAILSGPAVINFWSQPTGGAAYTDLLDEASAPITSVTSSDGSVLPLGTIPRFQGPDGVTYMWADTGASARYIMIATDLGDSLAGLATVVAALSSRMEDAENAVANLQAVAAISPVTVLYDEVGAAWPTRPAIAGTRIVFWLGPVGNPPPVGYMTQNDQFFGWQA